MKIRDLAVITTSLLLLTSCSSGGVSKPSENAFVSGNGAAVVIKEADRKPAPDISGTTLDGTTVALVKNKVTVLNIWASWCSPCRAEAPVLQDFAAKNSDIQFAGIITRDNLSSARAFVQRFKLSYPDFIDDSLIARFRGSLTPNAIPTTLIIDSKWRVAARISGETTVAALSSLLQAVMGKAPVA
jgi:thiol-disulfide isomerase/thioredoxin